MYLYFKLILPPLRAICSWSFLDHEMCFSDRVRVTRPWWCGLCNISFSFQIWVVTCYRGLGLTGASRIVSWPNFFPSKRLIFTLLILDYSSRDKYWFHICIFDLSELDRRYWTKILNSCQDSDGQKLMLIWWLIASELFPICLDRRHRMTWKCSVFAVTKSNIDPSCPRVPCLCPECQCVVSC